MVRIYTAAHPAQVICYQPLRDRPDKMLIGPPRGWDASASEAVMLYARVRDAVTVFTLRASPNPATAIGFKRHI
jgi:hypothetical protein